MNANPYDIELFYDGGCLMCSREMTMLRRWDTRSRLRFIDIDQPDFDPAAYGKSKADLTDQMHGRLPDGSWLRGVEVFRRMYAAIGFGWLVWFSRLPVVAQILEAGYWIFARNRLRLTGRCTGNTCSVSRAQASR